jgi:hypothetical protein
MGGGGGGNGVMMRPFKKMKSRRRGNALAYRPLRRPTSPHQLVGFRHLFDPEKRSGAICNTSSHFEGCISARCHPPSTAPLLPPPTVQKMVLQNAHSCSEAPHPSSSFFKLKTMPQCSLNFFPYQTSVLKYNSEILYKKSHL